MKPQNYFYAVFLRLRKDSKLVQFNVDHNEEATTKSTRKTENSEIQLSFYRLTGNE